MDQTLGLALTGNHVNPINLAALIQLCPTQDKPFTEITVFAGWEQIANLALWSNHQKLMYLRECFRTGCSIAPTLELDYGEQMTEMLLLPTLIQNINDKQFISA